MTKNKIIENSRHESDLLLLKAFKVIPFLFFLDLAFLYVSCGFKFVPIDYLTASNIIFAIIPLLYYHFSKERKHFMMICLICVEISTAIFYLTSWVYASLLWVLSFVIASLYFNEKLILKLFAIKMPLFIAASFIVMKTRAEFIFSPSVNFAVSSIIYYTLQLIVICLILWSCAKKSNHLFDTCLNQNKAIVSIFNANSNISRSIDASINELSDSLEISASTVESIAIHSSDIAIKASTMAHTASDTKKSAETVLSYLDDLILDSEQINSIIIKMQDVASLNQQNMALLGENIHYLNIYSSHQGDKSPSISETLIKLDKTQEDFNTMFSLQNQTISKITHMQQLIEKLSYHMNIFGDNSIQNLQQSEETSASISDISSSIEELTAVLQEISTSAKVVQSSSNVLITSMDEVGV